jgi:uncharacterized protein
LRFYLDTSVLVSALTHEAASERVRTWIAALDPEDILVSEWSVTEFNSALSIKQKQGGLTADLQARIQTKFNELTADSFEVLPVHSRHFRQAALFCRQSDLGLRAGDAVHIAVAAEAGSSFATLDRRMLRASQILGLMAIDPLGEQ